MRRKIISMPLAIFDLDNTLIDRDSSFRRWTAEMVARHDLDPSEVQWLVTADGNGFVPRPAFMSAVRDRYGLDDSLDTLLDQYRQRIVALVEPDPRVPAALDRLRADGWRVAIATNGATAQQWAKIRSTGLDAYVDAVAVSEEVGATKPDPRIFEVAAQRCGAHLADGGWMVGDCPTRDIIGAQGVGLRTIWLHRNREWEVPGATPDAIVDDVVQAVTVMIAQRPTS